MLKAVIKNDLRSNKKAMIKSVLYLIALFVCLSIVLSYVQIVSDGMKQADNVNASSNRIVAVVTKEAFANETVINEAKKIAGVEEILKSAQILFTANMYGLQLNDNPLVELNGGFALTCSDEFPSAYSRELKSKKYGELLVVGRTARATDEAVCSFEFLALFGLDNPRDAIGKRMRIYEKNVSSGTEHVLIFDKQIVGVTNDRIRELDVYSGQFLPTIFVQTACAETFNPLQLHLFFNVYSDSYFHREQLARDVAAILPKNCFIAKGSDSRVMAALERQRKTTLKILWIICALSAVGLTFGFFDETLKTAEENSDRHRVLFDTGMSKNNVSALIFAEDMIRSVFALIFSFAIAPAILAIITKAVSFAVGFSLRTNFFFVWIVQAINAGVAIVLAIISGIIYRIRFMKKNNKKV